MDDLAANLGSSDDEEFNELLGGAEELLLEGEGGAEQLPQQSTVSAIPPPSGHGWVKVKYTEDGGGGKLVNKHYWTCLETGVVAWHPPPPGLNIASSTASRPNSLHNFVRRQPPGSAEDVLTANTFKPLPPMPMGTCLVFLIQKPSTYFFAGPACGGPAFTP